MNNPIGYGIDIMKDLPKTEALQRVLELATARAVTEGHHYLGTDDVRYGLRREKAIRREKRA